MEPKEPTYSSEQREKEPYRRAVDFLFRTLDLQSEEIEAFEKALFEEIESLPHYKKLQESLATTNKEEIPKQVFDLLKRGEDSLYEELEGNGVLIDSMKTGKLECAGRTMIASRFFTNNGIEHAIATPYGHSMILLEQDADTFIYFDANNDLYFSFPKKALNGYQGIDKMSEVYLEEYVSREKDFFYGRNSVMRRMMLLSPRAGILNSYLNNAGAALGGAPEFVSDSIKLDEEASSAISKIKDEILGDENVPDEFYERGQKEKEDLDKEKQELTKIIRASFDESSDIDEFIQKVVSIDLLWRRWPYLQSEKDKKSLLIDWYNRLSEEEL